MRVSANDVMALRASTGLPVSWCKFWLESAPPAFIAALQSVDKSGSDEYRQLFQKLDRQGVVIPCPVCGSPVTVHNRGAFCSDDGRHFGWSVSTVEDRKAIERILNYDELNPN